MTAIDEHLYHPRMRRFLWRCRRRGVTCVPALGYQMVTREFPAPDVHLASVHTCGVPCQLYSKLRLFDPNAVEPNVAIGGHGAEPAGHVVYPRRDEVLLLHYKDLGIDYLYRRNQLLDTGLRPGDRVHGWGGHYRLSRAELEANFEDLWRHSVDVRAPGYVAWQANIEPRFWRPPGQPLTHSGRRPRRHPHLHRAWRWLAKMVRDPR